MELHPEVIQSILCDHLREAEKLLKVNNAESEVFSNLIEKAKNLPRPLAQFTAASPSRIGINVSYTCSLRCGMCNTGFSDRNRLYPDYLHLDQKMFDSFQPWIDGGNRVFFNGAGEPLESPKAINFLEQIKDKETWLFTSGVPLNRKKIIDLINAELDCLMLSFEGASPLGHGGLNFGYSEKFWEKVQLIQKLKKEKRTEKPNIVLRISVDNHNLDQLDNLIAKAFDIGLREIILFPTTPIKEEQFYDSIFFKWKEAKAKVHQIMYRWNLLGMNITILENSEKIEDNMKVCPYVNNSVVLDGKRNTVSLCCGPMEVPLALNAVPFEVFWNSFPVRYFRYLHFASEANALPKVCQECPIINLAHFTDKSNLEESVDKEEVLLLYRRASFEKSKGNFDLAKKQFSQVINQSASKKLSGKSWFHIGEIEVNEGNFTNATFSMRKSVQNYYTHSKAFAYLYLLVAIKNLPLKATNSDVFELNGSKF